MSGLDFDSIQAVVAAWQQQQQQQLHLTSQLSNATFIQHHGYRVPLPQALDHQGRWYIESGSGNARPSLSPNFVRPPHHFIRHPTAPAPIRLAGPPTSSEQIQPPHRVALQAAQLEGTRSTTGLLDAHTHYMRSSERVRWQHQNLFDLQDHRNNHGHPLAREEASGLDSTLPSPVLSPTTSYATIASSYSSPILSSSSTSTNGTILGSSVCFACAVGACARKDGQLIRVYHSARHRLSASCLHSERPA